MDALPDLSQLPVCADPVAALRRGVPLLTATNRLARGLRGEFEREQLQAGLQAWPTPTVLPWSAWLAGQLTTLTDAGDIQGVVLSAAQEGLLWEQLVAASEAGAALLRPEAAADAAASAYRLIQEWEIPRTRLTAAATPETENLLAWSNALEAQCAVRGWLPRAGLIALVTDAVQRGVLAAPPELLLAGFDDHPPAQARLLGALCRAGTRLMTLEVAVAAAQTQRLAAVDAAAEMTLAARWALARLQHDPGARIGIVVPDLAARRTALTRILDHTLHPSSGLADLGAPALYELSLGLPLVEHPVIEDALLALALLGGPQPLVDVGRLLRSPYLSGGQSEWAQRGALDARLRRHAGVTINLWQLAQQARDRCPRLAQALASARARLDALPGRAAPSVWAEHFDRLLSALGWPGERSLDSAEFQQVRRFRDLYSEFAALDRVTAGLSFRAALGGLRRLTADTLFQPEGRQAPIQVLGVLEAGGLRFDHLWVMGLDDATWPAPAAPHPLLPATLQRELGLPHASAERELGFARRLTQRLRRAAPEVILSYPLHDGERELRPSPLLGELPDSDPQQLRLAPATSPWEAAPPLPLQTLADALGPPAPPKVHGGTGLIAAQAACPFSAFAAYRLAAAPLEVPQHTPDGRQTGNLVHRALELLWRRLGSLARLRGTPPEELETLVAETAATALAQLAAERPDLYPQRFAALERRRLQTLLQDWLALERERAPFSVAHLEHAAELELGGLQLRIRADRIDALEDGRLVVIDYKTGKGARPGDWTGERPDQPQVPLYCIASAAPVAAAVIARVRSGDLALGGVATEDGLLPGVPALSPTAELADWDGLLAHWRSRLGALAAEVRDGLAAATPSATTCRYCPLPPLCRRAAVERDFEPEQQDVD